MIWGAPKLQDLDRNPGGKDFSFHQTEVLTRSVRVKGGCSWADIRQPGTPRNFLRETVFASGGRVGAAGIPSLTSLAEFLRFRSTCHTMEQPWASVPGQWAGHVPPKNSPQETPCIITPIS